MPFGTSWKTPAGKLAEARVGHEAFINNTANRLYVVAGLTGSPLGVVSSIKSAQLDMNGSVGPWRTETPLPAVRYEPAVAVAPNGIVYVVGGNDGSGADSTVIYYAQLGGDGSIGRWKQSAIPAPAALSSAHMVIMNDALVLFGGFSAGVAQTAAWVSRLNSDGSPGPFRSTSALPVATAAGAVFVKEDWIYLHGGIVDGNLTTTGKVYSCKLDVNYKLSAWREVGQSVTTRAHHQVAMLNDVLYVIGGFAGATPAALTGTTALANAAATVTGTTSAYSTELQAGDYIKGNTRAQWYPVASVTSATAATLARLFPETNFAAAAASRVRPTYHASVEFARLMPSGAISGFQASTGIVSGRQGGRSVVDEDGFCYLVGGFDASAIAQDGLKVANLNDSDGLI